MFNLIEKIIVKIFSNKFFCSTIDILLHIILKFKGYKNYGSLKDTGEEYFFSRDQFNQIFDLANKGIAEIIHKQKKILSLQ